MNPLPFAEYDAGLEDDFADMFEAIDQANADALALHERGQCHLSEWSCSHCEYDTDPDLPRLLAEARKAKP